MFSYINLVKFRQNVFKLARLHKTCTDKPLYQDGFLVMESKIKDFHIHPDKTQSQCRCILVTGSVLLLADRDQKISEKKNTLNAH